MEKIKTCIKRVKAYMGYHPLNETIYSIDRNYTGNYDEIYEMTVINNEKENLIREICLPIFVDITDEQVDYVIECVKKELS